MKLEYLIHEKKLDMCKDKINKLNVKNKSLSFDVNIIDNTDLRYITINIEGENQDNAKFLSTVNDVILEDDDLIVVSNEASEYFNKRLFPLVNEFERKLRKLLYLATIDNPDYKNKIQMLEEKDLGTIFGILFVDNDLMKTIQKWINENKQLVSKNEIINYLNGLKENDLWSKLFKKNNDDVLKNNYILVKNFRNDVMHAHNINYETYNEATKLFTSICKQLDDEIKKCVVVSSDKKQFNITLSEKLEKDKYQHNMDFDFNDLVDLKERIHDINKEMYQLGKDLKAISNSDSLKELNETQKKIIRRISK